MAPHPDSAAAAVETLRAELEMVNSALEGIDRRAAFVPAALGAIAGLFIAPDTSFKPEQAGVLLAALATGIVAVVQALRVLSARVLNVGPNAQQTAAGTHLEPAAFNHAVAGSLAMAIDVLAAATEWKGKRLNIAITFAALTVLLLAVARLIGGIL